jgi:hypothetical protein
MDSSSSSSRRKAPPLDPEDFASWELLFRNYCGYQEWDLFYYQYMPEIDMDELEQLQTPDGADTEESRRYVRQIKSDRKKYQKNTDKIRQNLVESLYDNPQTKLLAMEFQDYDTYDFYEAVVNRVKDTSVQSLNYHTGILNAMKCTTSDSRMDFANKLITLFLVVMNLGGEVDES